MIGLHIPPRQEELFAFYRAIEHFQSYFQSYFQSSYLPHIFTLRGKIHTLHPLHPHTHRPNLVKLRGKAKLGQTARESQTWPNCEGKPNLATSMASRGARSHSIRAAWHHRSRSMASYGIIHHHTLLGMSFSRSISSIEAIEAIEVRFHSTPAPPSRRSRRSR